MIAMGLALAVAAWGGARKANAVSPPSLVHTGAAVVPQFVPKPPADTPAIVGVGAISTRDNERGITFTPDGDTAYFTRAMAEPYFSVILVATRVKGRWMTPRVAEFSGRFSDSDPALSADGRILVFASFRPADADSTAPLARADLWITHRLATGHWGAPEHLREPINSAATDAGASFGPDGSLYFHSGRQGGAGGMDLWMARPEGDHFAAPVSLGLPNSEAWEGYPTVSADGATLVFTSMYRADEIIGEGVGYPRGDLYISTWDGSKWGTARHLSPPINSSAAECCARFESSGKTLYFTSERGFAAESFAHTMNAKTLIAGLTSVGNGLGNILALPVASLHRMADGTRGAHQ